MRTPLGTDDEVAPGDPGATSLVRPTVPRSVTTRASEWLNWFGLARLATAAVSVAIVVGGAVWLLRAPAPTVESSLPVARVATVPVTTMAWDRSPDPAVSLGSSTSALDGASVVTAEASAPIVVHVAGAVAEPGVYDLAATARVIDAVSMAGGTTDDADTSRINLAAPVADGQRVYVPAVDEEVPVEVISGGSTAGADRVTGGGAGPNPPVSPIDLNNATIDDLERLPGIGPATAAAIVDDRTRNGPFSSIDDLDRVSGIGPAKLAALAGLVTV